MRIASVCSGQRDGRCWRRHCAGRSRAGQTPTDPRGFRAAANRANEGVRIVALARCAGEPPELPEEDVIRAGRYPLNRHLLLHARRPLDPVAREYLRLVLSREGQEVVAGGSLGYLPLRAAEVAAELAKLE